MERDRFDVRDIERGRDISFWFKKIGCAAYNVYRL